MGWLRLLLGPLCVCFFQVSDGAALRQDIRSASANVYPHATYDATSSATSAKTFEGVGNATIDFVAVHCAEQYDVNEGGNGIYTGFSPLVWDAGNYKSLLRFRRRIIYTKCAAPLRVGPAFEVVNMSQNESKSIGRSSLREESAYIKHIVDNYHDLADWTVFVNGFPEEHNRYFFAWLNAFKRPKPTAPVYINLNHQEFVTKTMSKSFFYQLGLQGEVMEAERKRKEIIEAAGGVDKHNLQPGEVEVATSCCAQFIVSWHAIRSRKIQFWKHIQELFHQKHFKLVVEQTVMTMAKEEYSSQEDKLAIANGSNAIDAKNTGFVNETRNVRNARNESKDASMFVGEMSSRFGPNFPAWLLPGGGKQLQGPAENPDLLSYESVDMEGSKPYTAFEYVWHVLFRRPVADKRVHRDFWCTWFNNQTNSPCQQRQFRQCWGMRGRAEHFCNDTLKEDRDAPARYRHYDTHHHQTGHGFPFNMSRETLLSGIFCCGTGPEQSPDERALRDASAALAHGERPQV